MAHLLVFAGAVGWLLSIAVVVQRQRVLARRLVRLERMAGVRARRPPHDDLLSVLAPRVAAKGHVRIGPLPPTSDRVPKPPPASRTLPTVQHLAAMARPLQRAGG